MSSMKYNFFCYQTICEIHLEVGISRQKKNYTKLLLISSIAYYILSKCCKDIFCKDKL